MNGGTVFFRLLGDEGKAASLSRAIDDVRRGDPMSPTVHLASPETFRLVPTAPFAYWVSRRVRRKFNELPTFESDARFARRGPSTGDDSRRVRTWWEVSPSRIGRERAWVPFAKGGSYAPYYADIHLVVAWDESRRTFQGFFGRPGRMIERPESLEYFFRPGLTWSRRSQRGLSVRVLPAGCVFADKGPSAFSERAELPYLLAVLNSRAFGRFVALQMAFGSFETGVIQRTPIPNLAQSDKDRLASVALECVRLKRRWDSANESSHCFTLPWLVSLKPESLASVSSSFRTRMQQELDAFGDLQASIDNLVYRLYGISTEDQASFIESGGVHLETDDTKALEVERTDESEAPENEDDRTDPRELVVAFLSYAFGCAFGRWDVRLVADPSLLPKLADPFGPLTVCSPGTLLGPDALPAQPRAIVSEAWLRARADAITLRTTGTVERSTIAEVDYALRVAWDGVLADDPDHRDDLIRRVREAFAFIWGDNAISIEQEACDMIGVADLRDHFRHPGLFFADHLKRYSISRRQAPIYWPLSTQSGSYTIWLYYPRLTSDTVFTAVMRYVQPKIVDVERQLREARESHSGTTGREASRLLVRVEELSALLGELNELRDELKRVTELPYRPNLDDGVIVNAAPFHKLFRLPKWAKDTREVWQKLERGDYDWAHLAFTIWPDRVREKCRSDRSLAIGHDLENLYSGPRPSAAKKQRGRTQVAMDDDDC